MNEICPNGATSEPADGVAEGSQWVIYDLDGNKDVVQIGTWTNPAGTLTATCRSMAAYFGPPPRWLHDTSSIPSRQHMYCCAGITFKNFSKTFKNGKKKHKFSKKGYVLLIYMAFTNIRIFINRCPIRKLKTGAKV